MRNTDERLVRMHKRAAEIKRQDDKSRLRILGSLSAVLWICLVAVIQQVQTMRHEILTSHSTGSSLLSEDVGGYVLAAVVSFTAGVIITVIIYKYRNWSEREANKDTKIRQ